MWSYIFLVLGDKKILIGPYQRKNRKIDVVASLNMLTHVGHSRRVRAIPKKLADGSRFEGAEVYSPRRFNEEVMKK